MHVVIDTSVYRADPKRIKTGFQAITRLAAARRIQLHLPYYVRQEFLTQQAEHLSNDYNKIIKAASAVLRITAHQKTRDVIDQTLDQIKELANGAVETALEELDSWIADTQTLTYELDSSHGGRVTEAYFKGEDPFSSPKQRKDFPDAFIYESIRDIVSKHGAIHVIVADGNLKKSCDHLHDIQTYSDIEDFIRLPECQTLLQDLDEVRNIDRIRNRLPKELRFLENGLKEQIIDPLADTPVTCPRPADNEEASVFGVGTPRDTEFHFDQIEYYGEGKIGIKFSTVVEDCEINYFIFKSDWYAMDTEVASRISVSDWNRHYYSAEETRDVNVAGQLVLQISTDELRRNDLTDEDLNVLINDAIVTVEIDDASVSTLYDEEINYI